MPPDPTHPLSLSTSPALQTSDDIHITLDSIALSMLSCNMSHLDVVEPILSSMDNVLRSHALDLSLPIQKEWSRWLSTLQVSWCKKPPTFGTIRSESEGEMDVEQLVEDVVNRTVTILAMLSNIGGMANSSKDITIGPLSLSIHESTFADAGFGYQTWGSSQILAMLIITGRIPVANATILELGCGTGLSGLAAASYGAAHVFMTDFLDSLLDKARLNAKTNKIEKNVSVHKLDWREPSKITPSIPHTTFTNIIGADLNYDMEHGNLVASTCSYYLSKTSPDARIYLVLPVRPKFENEKEEFDIQMEAHGLVKEAFETYLQEDIQDMGLNGMDRAFSTGEKGFRFYVFKWAGK